jgi:hypothetical protein
MPTILPTLFSALAITWTEVALGVLLLALCVFVSTAATRWWLTRRDERLDGIGVVSFLPQQMASERRIEKTSPLAAITETQAATDSARRTIADVLVAGGRGRERECPKCQRTFPESVVICPHDSSRLSVRGDARHRVKVLDGVRKPMCSSCGRRYEYGAKYCRFDGQRLSTNAVERLAVVWVCRTCGEEALEEGHTCADGCEVNKLDPSDARVIFPMIPMMVCDSCHHVASPEVTHCPEDGDLLTPMVNVRSDALAPLGVGPRRKMCAACGRRFSGAARFCAYDGSRLSTLN